MRLIYLSHWRFPSEKTMTPLILRTCEGFAKLGCDVELWVPRRHNPDASDGDLLERYGIKERFVVRRIPALDLMRFTGVFGFILMVASFNLCAAVLLWRRRKEKGAVLYAHDMRDLLLPAFLGMPMFAEIHDFYESSFPPLNRFVLKRLSGLIVTNTLKMEKIRRRYGVPPRRMLHQQNAVDADMFSLSLSKAEARSKLALPADRRIALYTGHLFGWKGVHTLAEAAAHLPHEVWIYFVGGTPEDRAALKAHVARLRLPRIEFVPHQPHGAMPLYLRAADVLVLPNTAKEEASRVETSPVKLFEYLASGTPVVASDLPSIRDVVSEREVFFAAPDDARSFAGTIAAVLDNPGAAAKLAGAGLAIAKRNSWEARARAIMDFINASL